ncbi:hypothetical protein Y1Q_0000225 [Alligator mississippiensis]|uniref:Zonadhesin n=1 Tax=Alligator mississippiensis TaxID=8496 RepID=A0A151M8Q3_ALLMI|nr:hypothetical protein Y1Q_0000225 [Alligator mississippiensis]
MGTRACLCLLLVLGAAAWADLIPGAETPTGPGVNPTTSSTTATVPVDPGSGGGPCVVWGGQHIRTCDGADMSFWETCHYVLAQPQQPVPGPWFRVLGENKDTVAGVTRLHAAGVELPRAIISLRWGLHVLVNGSWVTPPFHVAPDTWIVPSGHRVLLLTADGLRVSWDGAGGLDIWPPRALAGQLCGLCGDADGDPGNDRRRPDGTTTTNDEDLGASWRVPDDPNTKCHPGSIALGDCSIEVGHAGKKPENCGQLLDPDGAFGPCQAQWRRPDLCPLSCPANSSYSVCSPICTPSCPATLPAPPCPAGWCAEGCVCQAGLVLSITECVPASTCGCLDFNGIYRPVGAVWLDDCVVTCTCHGPGNVTCRIGPCFTFEDCRFQDGEYSCYPLLWRVCQAWGDLRIITFDGRHLEVPGACTYILTQPCQRQTPWLPSFKVWAETEATGLPGASRVSAVRVRVHGHWVTLLPRDRARTSGSVLLLMASPEPTSWPPGGYGMALCGLCGNFNLEVSDDHLLPNGSWVSSSVQLGAAWAVPNASAPGCSSIGDPLPCDPHMEAEAKKLTNCGLMSDPLGPFYQCHYEMSPQRFVAACVQAVGESWMDDANCTRRCTCRSPENIACEAWSCLPGQECSERGRWLGCHDTRAATCYVFGNLHYVTFDGASVTLTGTCSYTLARVCGTHPGLEDFTVMGTNAPSDAPGSSFLVRVDMTVGGACMALLRGHQVLVDGVRVSPPLRNRLRGLAVTEAGTFVEVRSQGGLVLRYDGHHLLELRVPGAYYSQVCGLCGNFNHQPEDDLTLPAGCPAPSAPALGSAWQAPGPSPPGCQEDNSEDLMPPCSPEDLARWAALCQELQAPVFAVCHPRVPVAPFADACLFDLCATRGQASALCYAAQAYSKACQAQGGPPVAWRNSTFCPLLCPLNSCYTPCAPACPPSCAEPLAPTACPEDQACSEGCDCDVGHLRSGDACVPAGECGCVDDEGHYHSVNGVLTNLPFSPDDDLSIGFWGLQILLQTQGGFSVTFDGLHYAAACPPELVLPEPYRGVVGGLCGTLNGDPEDDFTLPDGASTHSLERFGEAWRVHAPPPRQSLPESGFEAACPASRLAAVNGSEQCGVLGAPGGPFAACHPHVPPGSYQWDCIYDLCALPDDPKLLCQALAAYGHACRQAGGPALPWRQETSCAPSAPPACSASCVEGCVPAPGWALSARSFVPQRYYQMNETFFTPGCTQRCTCRGPETLWCESGGCPPGLVCALAQLAWGCYIPGPCLSSPCENGGHCWELDGGFVCDCLQGFEGPRCETPSQPGAGLRAPPAPTQEESMQF